MSDATRSNVQEIVDAMTATMKIHNELGGAAKAAHGAPPRIVWAESTELATWEPPTRQPPTGRAYAYKAQPFEVEVWGADRASAELLEEAFGAALDLLFGLTFGAQVKGSRAAPERVTASGFVFVVHVVLRVPMRDGVYISNVTPNTGVSNGGVIGLDGDTPTPITP